MYFFAFVLLVVLTVAAVMLANRYGRNHCGDWC